MDVINVSAINAEFNFGDGRSVILPNIDVSFRRMLLIKGAIGSGKTLLLKALAGILQLDKGRIRITGNNNIFIHSQPEFNFTMEKIADELAFAGVDTGKFAPEYYKAIIKKSVHALSGGEQKKLSALMYINSIVHNGGVLLFDEPLDMLDDFECDALATAIAEISSHTPVIIAAHGDEFDSLADAIVTFPTPSKVSIYEMVTQRAMVDSIPLLNIDNIDIQSGEITCLYGKNGAGKTVLIRELAGIGKIPSSIGYKWHDDGVKRTFCLQFPEQMIYGHTVAQEIKSVVKSDNITALVLDKLGWSGRGDTSPFGLSHGEKRLMYILSLITAILDDKHSKSVAVFDEPFAGLDFATKELVAAEFRLAKAHGCAIVYSANRIADTALADKIIEIK